MKILIVHQGFPGQFVHLAKKLVDRGDTVYSLASSKKKGCDPRIQQYSYTIGRGNTKDVHPFILETESKVIRGEAAAQAAIKLKNAGFLPDLIIAHPGWGESLFLRDIWMHTPQLHYVEYSYGSPNTDYGFEDIYLPKLDIAERQRTRMKNANTLLNLDAMDWGITPTSFQHKTLPRWAQKRTSVIHDGIATDWALPDEDAFLVMNDGRILSAKDKIVTFVNRTFEPYRGIHKFLEAIESVLRSHSDCKIVLVGKDTPRVSYGAHRKDGQGWLNYLRFEVGHQIDWSRVFLLGKVPHETLRTVFQISSAHVYLTYPFVLSWSMLEAMSCGCIVIGSDTAPVSEVIKDSVNGFLVPFNDSQMIAKKIDYVLSNQLDLQHIRDSARKTIVDRYRLEDCLQKQVSLLDAVANRVIVDE